MDESKIHIKTPKGEVVVRRGDLAPSRWIYFEKTGLRVYTLWVHPEPGA